MIGTGELIVILLLVMVLFGGKKLPELARNLGKGMREFKKACNGDEETRVPIEIEAESCEKKCGQCKRD